MVDINDQQGSSRFSQNAGVWRGFLPLEVKLFFVFLGKGLPLSCSGGAHLRINVIVCTCSYSLILENLLEFGSGSLKKGPLYTQNIVMAISCAFYKKCLIKK